MLLIVIDGLRADLPWTGYPRDVAPWMTAFSKHSVVYTRAYSVSSTTARSVAALLTGQYPSELARDGYFFSHYYDDNLFISERIQQAGHHTLAVAAHAYFLPGMGLEQGFQTYRVLPGTYMNNDEETNVTSDRITELAQKLLGERIQQPGRFFAYLHYMDPHLPYLRHPDRPQFGQTRRDMYDQEVHFTDEWVGKLVDWAKAQAWGRNTAFIITADHGEGLGEHGWLKHGYHLWEELIQVPLLIQAPGIAPRRIDVPRSHIDLAKTILDLMGVEARPPLRGVSLVPELLGSVPLPRPVIADLPRDDLQERARAVIQGDWKVITYGDDASWFVFDLSRDPDEAENLADRPDVLERMQKMYREQSSTIPTVEIRGPAVQLKGAPEGRRW
ncbi:MAG TPA: sulfatase [Polyangiaceae bacterium]